jgi:hypothetical protein
VKNRARLKVAAALAAGTIVAVPAAVAMAAEAEPAVSSFAWYWKSQRSQPVTDPTSGADVATVELPSPFCPTAPGLGSPGDGAACEEGRLPIEVQGGDYREPDKISAVAFDLSLVPMGSTVKKFTATFVESDSSQSKPANSEGKSLQACPINEFFGDGDAREYKEQPKFECTDGDPVAERKAIKVGGQERFGFTFDLTPLAQQWFEAGAPVTGVMLTPVRPDPFNGATDNNWRTVLAGPKEENGIRTSLRYTPGDGGIAPIADPGDFGGGGFDDGTGGGFGGGSVGGSDFGGGGFGEAEFDEAAGDDEVEESAEPTEVDDVAIAAEVPELGTGGLPGYVWLAIIAGLMGFSAVRSVVLESAAGIRPDGVLAQIRQINSGRSVAGTVAGAGASPLSAIASTLSGLGEKATSLFHKLPFVRKG